MAYGGFLLEVAGLAMALTRLRESSERKHPEASTFSIMEPASIVVSARNEEIALPAFLAALDAQETQRPLRLLFVDDGSIDQTAGIAQTFLFKHIKFSFLQTEGVGKLAALEMATKKVTSQLLLFTDADTQPHPQWLEEHIATLQKADVSFGHVQVFSSAPLRQVESVLSTLRTLSSEVSAEAGGLCPPFVRGANWALRQKVFQSAGAFSGLASKASGDDVHLVKRLKAIKAVFAYSPLARVKTIENLEPATLHQQSRRRYSKGSALDWTERLRQLRLGAAITAWFLAPLTLLLMRPVDMAFWLAFWLGSIFVPLVIGHRLLKRAIPLLLEDALRASFFSLLRLAAKAFYFTLLSQLAGYSWKATPTLDRK
jgi:cellulose synthase/poly-beta-1,6-N-acetylglucosamine synthase-like glycosyltransferase